MKLLKDSKQSSVTVVLLRQNKENCSHLFARVVHSDVTSYGARAPSGVQRVLDALGQRGSWMPAKDLNRTGSRPNGRYKISIYLPLYHSYRFPFIWAKELGSDACAKKFYDKALNETHKF